MEVAPGVMLEGQFHAGSTGDRDVPGESSWVDVDSLKVSGRPDLVALWVFDACPDLGDWGEAGCPKRSAFLEELAGRLRGHHEEEVPS
jgi:hypothetical protein